MLRLGHSGPAAGELSKMELVSSIRHVAAAGGVDFVVAVCLGVFVDDVSGHGVDLRLMERITRKGFIKGAGPPPTGLAGCVLLR